MCKWISLVITCCVALAQSGSAQANSWIEVRSPHFLVVSNGTEDEGRTSALQLERMRAVFQKLFPNTNLDTAVPPLVVAIADRATMEKLAPAAYAGRTQSYLAGLFLTWPERDYILVWLNAPGLHPYAPIYHEYAHFVLHRSGQWIPLWLDEGLAEYFKTTEIAGDEVRIGKADAQTISFLEQHQPISLATLLTVDQHSPYYSEEDKTSIFYSESWALTHFLKTRDLRDGTNHIGDYLGYVQSGSDPVAAATRVFGDLDQLKSELQNYINTQGYAYSRMAGRGEVDISHFRTRSITRQEANLARADFLVHDGRASDGRVLLESVLRDETGNGRALEIMGWLSLREHKFQEARQFCERAIQADDRSFLGHICFALSSMQGTAPRTSPEQARIEQSLRTAIRVNASFAPAYAGLGEYLSFRAKYQEALSAARKAVQLEPGMVEFRNEEANILLRMNRVKEATDSLNFALKLAHAPEEVAAVEAVLHSATQINYHKRRTD